MNEKEVAEIRRRFRPDKNIISALRGCYVNDNHEIVSEFEQSLLSSPEEEVENILATLRRTLSGGLGKKLIDLEFATQQVVDSDEHRLLMALRDSALKDEEAVQAFYQKVIASLDLAENYLILLIHDTYDIPYRAGDGNTFADGSTDVYSYVLCSICPVKMSKPSLSYYMTEKKFHNRKIDWLVSAPELGFLFPAFDDRSTNIYNALYYTRNTAESHPGFVDAVFHCPLPLPAKAQQEAFQTILQESLADDCSYDVIESVHGQLRTMIEEHKESKDEEPLVISRQTVKRVLSACGVSDEKLDTFTEKYDEAFGKDATLSPKNIIDDKKFEVSTPDVTIQVHSDRRDLVETRVIDGVQCIIIRVEGGVTVNGTAVHIE